MRSRPPALEFRRPQPDGGAEIDGARNVRAGLAPHQVGEPARQLALVGLGIGAEQHVGDGKPEHVVAEKLKPLIAAAAPVLAHQGRDMREPAFQQRGLGKSVPDPLLERSRGLAPTLAAGRSFARRLPRRAFAAVAFFRLMRRRRSSGNFGLAAHRTIVNNRLQRTDQGQRHTSRARSPSATEKKMIWARPMMFSNGT